MERKFHLLIILLACLSCKQSVQKYNNIENEAKWMIYSFNYRYSGVMDQKDTITPIACELKRFRVDTINTDTIMLFMKFSHEGKEVIIEPRERSVIGVGIVKGQVTYPIYGSNFIPDDISELNSLAILKDSIERNFIDYGKNNQEQMEFGLKKQFADRLKR